MSRIKQTFWSCIITNMKRNRNKNYKSNFFEKMLFQIFHHNFFVSQDRSNMKTVRYFPTRSFIYDINEHSTMTMSPTVIFWNRLQFFFTPCIFNNFFPKKVKNHVFFTIFTQNSSFFKQTFRKNFFSIFPWNKQTNNKIFI